MPRTGKRYARRAAPRAVVLQTENRFPRSPAVSTYLPFQCYQRRGHARQKCVRTRLYAADSPAEEPEKGRRYLLLEQLCVHGRKVTVCSAVVYAVTQYACVSAEIRRAFSLSVALEFTPPARQGATCSSPGREKETPARRHVCIRRWPSRAARSVACCCRRRAARRRYTSSTKARRTDIAVIRSMPSATNAPAPEYPAQSPAVHIVQKVFTQARYVAATATTKQQDRQEA